MPPLSAAPARQVQLLLGLVVMMAISSPQYVWTLFVPAFWITRRSALIFEANGICLIVFELISFYRSVASPTEMTTMQFKTNRMRWKAGAWQATTYCIKVRGRGPVSGTHRSMVEAKQTGR